MKKRAISRCSCFVLCFLAAALAAAGGQAQQAPAQKIGVVVSKKPPMNPPTINSINENFQPMAIDLALYGANFPSKHAPNNVARLIRLVPVGASGEYFIGQTGDWTPTVLHDTLGFAIPVGRRFRIGIVEFQEMPSGPHNLRLISNEREFLILMNLDHVSPNSVHGGGVEVEVTTANELGPQEAKIVKLGNMTCQVTHWPASGGIFKVRLPSKVAKGTYDLFVQENGIPVSKKIPLTVTGGK